MARRKAKTEDTRQPPKTARKPEPDTGTGALVLKLICYLAILVGVGYAAGRVPIGGKTLVEHAGQYVKWDAVQSKASEASRAARAAVAGAIAKAPENKQVPTPAKAPVVKPPPAKPTPRTVQPKPPVPPVKKPSTKVATAEQITDGDRDRLTSLMR